MSYREPKSFHIEERKETLIVTDLDKGTFKVLPNTEFNKVRYYSFNGEKINFKLDDNLSISETSKPNIFKITYGTETYRTDITETEIIGKILNEALLNNNPQFAYGILAEYVEIAISRTIQRDLITYLLASYLDRLEFTKDYIVVNGVFRVFYDAWNNHQDVLTSIDQKGKKTFSRLCLVRIRNEDFKPSYFEVNGKYYVIGKGACEILSKILYLLEPEKHKNDLTFWRQIEHLYRGDTFLNVV